MGKQIDEQIQKAIKDKDIELLKQIIDLSANDTNEIENCFMQNIKLPNTLLKQILIARDQKKVGLKKAQITTEKIKNLELDEAFINYNVEIDYNKKEDDEIVVMRGKNSEGKDVIIYYYENELLNNWATRQMRVFNSFGHIESLERDGLYADGGCTHLDRGIIAYKYDNHGNRKVALYQDEITGMKYLEYDKKGDIALIIEDQYIGQKVEHDNKSYMIYDGYFTSTSNGMLMKKNVPANELKPDDIERNVSGDATPEIKEALLSELDFERKEKIISILEAIEPVFKSAYSFEYMDSMDTSKMQKIVQWFEGFSKRLKINPKLATQDGAVMSAMKKAIGKNIGKLQDIEKELTKDLEKEDKGEVEYGDK